MDELSSRMLHFQDFIRHVHSKRHMSQKQDRTEQKNNTTFQPARGSATTGPGEGPGWTTCTGFYWTIYDFAT
jgi:hypothetical protein